MVSNHTLPTIKTIFNLCKFAVLIVTDNMHIITRNKNISLLCYFPRFLRSAYSSSTCIICVRI